MKFVPWQYIQDWKCDMCGICCKLYSVVIDFQEWLQISKTYGVEKTVAGLDRFYINRESDGSCPFVYNFAGSCLCGLQNVKPGACKQWPFKVMFEPRFGDANHALYTYGGLRLFIYADSMCSGLRYGSPRWNFASLTLRVRGNYTRKTPHTKRNHSLANTTIAIPKTPNPCYAILKKS